MLRPWLYQVKPEDSVASLKETLKGLSGIAVQQQMLIHNGRDLQSRCTKLPAAVDISIKRRRFAYMQISRHDAPLWTG